MYIILYILYIYYIIYYIIYIILPETQLVTLTVSSRCRCVQQRVVESAVIPAQLSRIMFQVSSTLTLRRVVYFFPSRGKSFASALSAKPTRSGNPSPKTYSPKLQFPSAGSFCRQSASRGFSSVALSAFSNGPRKNFNRSPGSSLDNENPVSVGLNNKIDKTSRLREPIVRQIRWDLRVSLSR